MMDIATLAVRTESTGVVQVTNELSRLDQAAGRVENSVQGLQNAWTGQLAKFAATTAVVGAVVSKFGEAARAAGALESSLASAGSSLRLTRTQMGALELASRQLSAGTVFSAAQIAEAFSDIAADAGKLADTPEKLSDITAAVVELATATRSQLPEASEALMQVLRLFEDASAGQAVDVVVSLGSTASELQETIQALGAAGPIARALGVSLTETAAAISTLADAGIEGSEAGSGLALVMRQLDAEADQNLRPSVVGLEQSLRNAAAAQFEFEGRSLAVGTELARNADQIGRVTVELQETGTGARLAAEAMGTFEAQSAQLTASLSTLQTTIGTALLPAMSSTTSAANDLLTAMGSLAEVENPFDGEDVDYTLQFGDALRGVGLGFVGLQGIIQTTDLYLSAWIEKTKIAFVNTFDAQGASQGIAAVNAELEKQLRLLDQAQGEAFNDVLFGPERKAPTLAKPPEAKPPAVTALPPLPQTAEVPAPKAPKATVREPADNSPSNQLAAKQYIATAQADAADDPIERLRIQFEAEMAAYEEQGSRLQALTVLTEDQRLAAVAQRRQAGEESLLQQQEAMAVTKQATLMNLDAELAVTEFEADRLRLDAHLLMQQDYLARELGAEREAARIVAELRTRGYSEIQKKQQESAKVQQQISLRAKQEQLRFASETATGLVLLADGSSKKLLGIEKAAALASAAVNIPLTASKAYAWGAGFGGPPAGIAAAAVAIAAQVGYMSQIASGGGGGGGGGGGSLSLGSSNYNGPEQRGPLYEEEEGADTPTVAMAKRSDQFFPGSPALNDKGERATIQPPPDGPVSMARTVNAPTQQAAAQPRASSSLSVARADDIRVATPQLAPLAVTAPRLPALEAPELKVQAEALRVDPVEPLQFNAPELELAEPTWNLPALTVNTPSVTLGAATAADRSIQQATPPNLTRETRTTAQEPGPASRVAASEFGPLTVTPPTLRAPALPEIAVRAPRVPELVAPRLAPLSVTAPTLEAPVLRRPPSPDASPERTPRSVTVGAPVIHIHNETGKAVSGDVTTESGPDGEQLIRIVLYSVAKDIS